MNSKTNHAADRSQPACNVSSKFNFTVGAFAIAVALVIGYLAYGYWWK